MTGRTARRRPAGLRPGRAAGRRGREDHDRPLPGPALAGAGLLRHPAPRHRGARLRPRDGPSAATPTTTPTSGSAPSLAPLGRHARPVAASSAGDICAVARLGSAETGDTLSAKDDPLLVDAVAAARAAAADRGRGGDPHDEDKLAKALQPAGRRGPDGAARAQRRHRAAACSGASARRTPRSCWTGCGPATASSVDTVRCGSPLRETLRRAGRGSRPARQAVRRPRPVRRRATSRSSRCPRGSGRRVRRAKVVGGAVPRNYIRSVEKGVRHAAGARRRRAGRSSTSGSPCSTARRTASTPPTRRSSRPGRSRCARPPRPRGRPGARALERGRGHGCRTTTSARCSVRPVRPPGPGHRHRTPTRTATARRARRGARAGVAALRASCARSPHGTGRFTRRTCATSPPRPRWRRCRPSCSAHGPC